MKKSVCFITILCLTLCVFFTGCSKVQPNDSGYFAKASAQTGKQTELENKAIINSLRVQTYIDGDSKAQKSYGGKYIDDDKILHVMFTEKVKEYVIEEIGALTQNSVTIEVCEYSYNELTELKDYIKGCISKDADNSKIAEISNSIISVVVYEDMNKVKVRIKDCDDEKIALFKEVISDSDAVMIVSDDK